MPRYPRLFVSGVPVHIVQRGHDRQTVFNKHEDFAYYLDNVKEAKSTYDVRVHAYCLMTNHVHLLISPGVESGAVSAFMKVLAGRQTRRTNRKAGRTGTLWDGRFKASLIDSSTYLLACYRYIELNPLRAGICRAPADYRWSSYRHNSGIKSFGWLDSHAEYDALATTLVERQSRYRQFVASAFSANELKFIRTALNRNQITGGKRFRWELERDSGQSISIAAPGRPRKSNK